MYFIRRIILGAFIKSIWIDDVLYESHQICECMKIYGSVSQLNTSTCLSSKNYYSFCLLFLELVLILQATPIRNLTAWCPDFFVSVQFIPLNVCASVFSQSCKHTNQTSADPTQNEQYLDKGTYVTLL